MAKSSEPIRSQNNVVVYRVICERAKRSMDHVSEAFRGYITVYTTVHSQTTIFVSDREDAPGE
jgi:hypothetical protein